MSMLFEILAKGNTKSLGIVCHADVEYYQQMAQSTIISLDILETLEQAKGLLLALPIDQKLLHVGVVPSETLPNQIPYGLKVVGTVGPPQALQKYPLGIVSTKREEGLKKNVPISLKKLKLTLDPDEEVAIVSSQTANDLLKRVICITSKANPHFEQLKGYRYRNKSYNFAQLEELSGAIHSDWGAYIHALRKAEAYEQGKLLIQPLQVSVELICTLGEPAVNTLETSSAVSSPLELFSFFIVPAIESPSVYHKEFAFHLQKHTELVLQSGKEYTRPVLPDFLKRLPMEAQSRFTNIHQYLPVELLWQHVRYFCRGRYHFHHYGEEQFNDRGWGCAYRACQTVLSWFNEQRYASIPIPSIPEMQKLLFEIDRTRNLVNTSEWIGANEVGWLLTKLCGVDCKIVHLPNGANIMEKVEQLRHHLQTSGTPIMYGGRDKAFTIVGINYSWETGECQFLIVDPHYTEQNTVKQIVNKEGVYWRDKSKLFSAGCFYNFCLPQVTQ